MKKIIIFGYPHSGTSILKSIIGHIDNVYEIVEEAKKIPENLQLEKKYEYVLIKTPLYHPNIFNDSYYDDFIKIFIIRNPLFVFSSINRRNVNNIETHTPKYYSFVLTRFIHYENKPLKNVFTIRYEDLFDSNFQNIKNILNKIGLKYSNTIFDNSKYTNKIKNNVPISNNKPSESNHVSFRQWQINQPFVSNNLLSKIQLTHNQLNEIVNDKNILSVYPEISTIIKKLKI